MPLRSFVTLLLLCLSLPIRAARPTAEPPSAVDLWNAMLKDAMVLLQKGEYSTARPLVEAVTTSMLANLGRGEGAHHALGLALTYRAVALEGIQLHDDALWYWHTALNLYPKLAEMDLSVFCAPGEFLAAHPLRAAPLPVPPESELTFLLPPTELSRVKPVFPRGALGFEIAGDVVVEVLITPSGSVSSPYIISPLPAPTMAYAALEAVRQWCYLPATADGVPIAVPLTVTVTFKLARR